MAQNLLSGLGRQPSSLAPQLTHAILTNHRQPGKP